MYRLLVGLLFGAIVVVGCSQQPPTIDDQIAAVRAAVNQANAANKANDVDGMVSAYHALIDGIGTTCSSITLVPDQSAKCAYIAQLEAIQKTMDRPTDRDFEKAVEAKIYEAPDSKEREKAIESRFQSLRDGCK
jgi:hypothetical protein